MIEFLIGLIILIAIVYVARILVPFLGLPEPITKILYLIIGLIALFWLLDLAGIYHFSLR